MLGSLLVEVSRLVVLLLVELVAHSILGGGGTVDGLIYVMANDGCGWRVELTVC